MKKELEKETFNSELKVEKVTEIFSSFGENQLDMDGRDLDYYAEINKNGTIKYLEISDGQFYYQYSEDVTDGKVVDLEKDNPSSKIEYKIKVLENI